MAPLGGRAAALDLPSERGLGQSYLSLAASLPLPGQRGSGLWSLLGPLQLLSLPPDKGLSRATSPRSGTHVDPWEQPVSRTCPFPPALPAALASDKPHQFQHLPPGGLRAVHISVPHTSSGLAAPRALSTRRTYRGWPQCLQAHLPTCLMPEYPGLSPSPPAQFHCPTHLIQGHAPGCVQALRPLGLKWQRAWSPWPDTAQVSLPDPASSSPITRLLDPKAPPPAPPDSPASASPDTP